MSWELILYFILGLVLEILGILDFKATQHLKPLRASAYGFAGSQLSDIVLILILISPEGLVSREMALIAFTCYNLGAFTGSLLILSKLKKKKDEIPGYISEESKCCDCQHSLDTGSALPIFQQISGLSGSSRPEPTKGCNKE